MREIERHYSGGGQLIVLEHDSISLGCSMRFALFLPSVSSVRSVPFLTFLSGLTCSYANFSEKAGAFLGAERANIALLIPDTSPRGAHVPDDEAYDLGQGAGFYLNATASPWSEHYHMESYITEELPSLVADHFSVNLSAQSISGHSMGGHGALTLYFKHRERYRSVSAFAPIVAPSQTPWGKKAFDAYFGADASSLHSRHDACLLVANAAPSDDFILIDQGTGDKFLSDELRPELFAHACQQAGQALNLRMQEGYDHSYFFIASFIEQHIAFHAAALS